MIQAASARAHLALIASRPRPAGGEAEARVRGHCCAVLRSHGLNVIEEPFEYSAFPGLAATPIAGACSIILLIAAAILGSMGRALQALIVIVGSGAIVAATALWMAKRGVLDFPFCRRRGINVTATRGEPRIWLVAHIDSKSQPVPIIARAAGITLSLAFWLVALGLAMAQVLGLSVQADVWGGVALGGTIAGMPVAASIVGSASDGAVDNASGVAAVLLAVEQLAVDRGIGVLLTSAEELGLAGARAWATGRASGIAINFDGLDDRGSLHCTFSREKPVALVRALESAARANGVRLLKGRLWPGVLVDGVALADHGWRVATLSKGTVSTVTRIHTSRDTLAMFTQDGGSRGVVEAVMVATSAVEALS